MASIDMSKEIPFDFSEFIDWDLLEGSDLAHLLSLSPQYSQSNNIDWDKLEGYNWVDLLECRPEFSEHCNYEKMDTYSLSNIFSNNPLLFEKSILSAGKWRSFSADEWGGMIKSNLGHSCDILEKYNLWNILRATEWTTAILATINKEKRINYIEEDVITFLISKCNKWKDFKSHDWRIILQDIPILAIRPDFPVKFNTFNTFDWAYLLCKRPHFAKQCKIFNLFGGEEICALLLEQPDFKDSVNLDNLEGWEWHELMIKHPNIFGPICHWGKFSNLEISDLLIICPEISRKFGIK